MSSIVYASALNYTINEIKKICPEVANSFVFQDLDLIAVDDSVPKKNFDQAIEAFNSIKKEGKPVGDLLHLRIEGTKGKVNIACLENFNFATVISNQADENYVNTLTNVLVPTVVKLVDELELNKSKEEIKIKTDPEIADKLLTEEVEVKQEIEQKIEKKELPLVELIEPPPNEKVNTEEQLEISNEESKFEETIQEEAKTNFEDKAFLTEPPVTQLIVEKLTGLLVPSDTVRIDKEIIDKWNELYEGKEIKMLLVENVNGKSTKCKYRNIKSSKHAGKGVIRIPDKIQSILKTSKGELVTIKPIIS